MASFFMKLPAWGRKMDDYNNKKAKLKSIIRDSLANDNGNTSQKSIIEIYLHDRIVDVDLSASAMGKVRIK